MRGRRLKARQSRTATEPSQLTSDAPTPTGGTC